MVVSWWIVVFGPVISSVETNRKIFSLVWKSVLSLHIYQ